MKPTIFFGKFCLLSYSMFYFYEMVIPDIYNTYKPAGFGTVSPYILTSKGRELISFLQNAFFADVVRHSEKPDGTLINCILKIGDSCFMIGQTPPSFSDTCSSFYLYVSDVDAMHQNALQHGAVEIFPPDDMPYRDRQSGVRDICGNYWWISRRLVEEDYSS